LQVTIYHNPRCGKSRAALALLRDPLAVEHAQVYRIDVAIAKLGMVIADIDYDDAARHVRKQPPRKIGDGLRWNRKDNDFSGIGGVDNGNGRRADPDRQRGQALRPPRVRNRDVMAELGEVARKYPSHASSADDSDSHVDSPVLIVTTVWHDPRHNDVSMLALGRPTIDYLGPRKNETSEFLSG